MAQSQRILTISGLASLSGARPPSRRRAWLAASSVRGIGAPANFNETEYGRRNPDVARAVGAGQFSSAAAHYDAHGAKEGRIYLPDFPADFSAKLYLDANPDVAGAVSAGRTPSAAHHYQALGIQEGRRYRADKPPLPVPSPPPAPAPSPSPAPSPDPSTTPGGGLAPEETTPFYKKPIVWVGGAALAAGIIYAVASTKK